MTLWKCGNKSPAACRLGSKNLKSPPANRHWSQKSIQDIQAPCLGKLLRLWCILPYMYSPWVPRFFLGRCNTVGLTNRLDRLQRHVPDQLKNLKQPLSQLSHEFPGLNPSRKVQAKAPAWDDSWICPHAKGQRLANSGFFRRLPSSSICQVV